MSRAAARVARRILQRPEVEEVAVPASLAGPAEILYRTYVVSDGELRSTGLCRTPIDAATRARAMQAGEEVAETPRGQVSEGEMECARRWSWGNHARLDDSPVHQAVEAAISAGPDTVEWALASRLVFSGMLPYRQRADGSWAFAGTT